MRVLVTNVEFRGALAAMRGLARRGYVVTGAAGVSAAAGHWSRSCDRRLTIPDYEHDGGRAFVEAIAAELARDAYLAVLPGTDTALRALSEHRDLLPPSGHAALPAADAVDRCLDKLALGPLAAAAGIGEPESASAASVEEAVTEARRLGYPLAVKPSTSATPGPRRTTRRVQDEAGLRDAAAEFGLPLLLQRYLPDARLLQVGGVVDGGSLRAIAVSVATATWPVEAGSCRRGQTIVPPPGLPEAIEDLMARTGHRGIFEVELLETAAGDRHAIDLNPRPYGHMALALRAGANHAGVYADLIAGREPRFEQARPGVSYRWEIADIQYATRSLRHGRVRDAFRAVAPSRAACALLELRDPGPFVARAARFATRRLRRR